MPLACLECPSGPRNKLAACSTFTISAITEKLVYLRDLYCPEGEKLLRFGLRNRTRMTRFLRIGADNGLIQIKRDPRKSALSAFYSLNEKGEMKCITPHNTA
jgi:hypothetical protein